MRKPPHGLSLCLRNAERSPLRLCLLCAVIGAAVQLSIQAAPPVYIRAKADPEYVAARAADPSPRVESYVFYQGRFFPGYIRDRTLEKMKFVEVAGWLAPQLRKKHYVPASTLATADLILVVHWGTTMGINRSDSMFDLSLDNQTQLIGATLDHEREVAAAINADPVMGNFSPAVTSAQIELNDRLDERVFAIEKLNSNLGGTTNAALLGIADLVWEEQRKPFVSARLQTLNAMLDEDRYFVLIMAYDRRMLMEEKKLKRVWSTRISMRSPGVNFKSAINHLGAVGADFFGLEGEKFEIRRQRTKRGEVKLGELQVLDDARPTSRNSIDQVQPAPDTAER